jgi:hypothetical protein
MLLQVYHLAIMHVLETQFLHHPIIVSVLLSAWDCIGVREGMGLTLASFFSSAFDTSTVSVASLRSVSVES